MGWQWSDEDDMMASLLNRRLTEVKSVLSFPSAGTLMADEANLSPAGASTEAVGKCLVLRTALFFRLNFFSSRLARRFASKVLVAWWMV